MSYMAAHIIVFTPGKPVRGNSLILFSRPVSKWIPDGTEVRKPGTPCAARPSLPHPPILCNDFKFLGQAVFLCCQGVVSGGLYPGRQPFKQGGLSVHLNAALLSVHQLPCVYDGPSEGFTDSLMPKHTPRIGILPFNSRTACSRIPASFGYPVPGTGPDGWGTFP